MRCEILEQQHCQVCGIAFIKRGKNSCVCLWIVNRERENSEPESRQRSSSEDVVKNDNAHPMKMSCEEELYICINLVNNVKS